MLLSSFEPCEVCLGLFPGSICKRNNFCTFEVLAWFFVQNRLVEVFAQSAGLPVPLSVVFSVSNRFLSHPKEM